VFVERYISRLLYPLLVRVPEVTLYTSIPPEVSADETIISFTQASLDGEKSVVRVVAAAAPERVHAGELFTA
jgi:hypothetical protein